VTRGSASLRGAYARHRLRSRARPVLRELGGRVGRAKQQACDRVAAALARAEGAQQGGDSREGGVVGAEGGGASGDEDEHDGGGGGGEGVKEGELPRGSEG
jgi:hypothetical protein